MWPDSAAELERAQEELGRRDVPLWRPPRARGYQVAPEGGAAVQALAFGSLALAGCWVCFSRGITGPGARGDSAWAAAVVIVGSRTVASRSVTGSAAAPYLSGFLALREGPVLAQVVELLSVRPDVLLVNATGRDHPRRAGLALQLGAVLDLPSIGVTHRPLLAEGEWPVDRRGAAAPLRIGDEVVGAWLRTAPGRRPVAVSPGWRTEVSTAVDLVRHLRTPRRTPEPLRQARRLARSSRALAERT